jgi:UDP-N-acetylglucosamine 2-epimerase (non-hydrolysing)
MALEAIRRMKVMTIVGTRPEIIKLSRVMAELDRVADHILVHTGQNHDYELNQVFFDDLQIRKPDHFLSVAAAGPAQTIGNVIIASDAVMEREKPEAVLILGDTNSCLSIISAKRQRIPIFHMEAGNRCFDQRVPEEINRKIIDHTSDINFTHTEHARRYLLAEGIRPETVIKSGSPMREVLNFYGPKIDASDVLPRLGLKADGYFLVSAHREENVDSEARLKMLLTTLNEIRSRYSKPVIVSVHPRTAKRLRALGVSPEGNEGGIHFMKPLGFFDYVKLQRHAFCVLSDSGTLTEEGSILGDFPSVMLRDAHERPEGMDVGTTVMCGLSPKRVLQAVELVRAQHKTSGRSFRIVPDYEPDDVSRKVVRVIHSYRDYVMRTVWHESTP